MQNRGFNSRSPQQVQIIQPFHDVCPLLHEHAVEFDFADARATKCSRRSIVTDDAITILPGSRFRAAIVLAVVADALQLIVFPVFVEGALSPADDVLDFGIGAMMISLLGWHWEFLPSFLGKLVPGVDLVPFWTMAVANVYRKTKPIAVTTEEVPQEQPALKDR